MNKLKQITPAVLIIDDEKINRERLKELFIVTEFRCYTAESIEEGLELFRAKKDEIVLVFLDMLMQNVDGNRVIDALKKINSDLKVICMSDNIREIETHIQNMSDIGLVKKPITIKQLLNELNEVARDN